jgi:hypothetical protein
MKKKSTNPAMAMMAARAMRTPSAAGMQAPAAPMAPPAAPMGTMKKGGKVSQLSKANGVATKGKTKGTFIKMAGSDKGMKKGGKC